MKEKEGADQLKDFVRELWDSERMCVITEGTVHVGIDPGATGGIAFIHPTDLRKSIAIDIPNVRVPTGRKTKSGKKSYRTKTDLGALWDLFRICKPLWMRLMVTIEQQQPMPRDTALTGFTVGKNFGMWPLFLYSHGIIHDTIRPVAWKRKQGLLKRDKEVARLKAQKLFPNASLSRKKDHNRAEALLIAYTMRMENDG
jgi:crossover junction endodeoxyribonuclease RuvC